MNGETQLALKRFRDGMAAPFIAKDPALAVLLGNAALDGEGKLAAPAFIRDGEDPAEAAVKRVRKLMDDALEQYLTRAAAEEIEAKLRSELITRDDLMNTVRGAVDEHLQKSDRTAFDKSESRWSKTEHSDSQYGPSFSASFKMPTMRQVRAVMAATHQRATLTEFGNVTGAPIDALELIYALVAGNPWRPYITTLGMSTGAMRVPTLGDFAWTAASSGNLSAITATATTGKLTSVDLVADEYRARVDVGNPTVEDLPSILDMLDAELMQQYALAQGKRITAIIKASAKATGGFNRVATGQAKAIPASTAILGKARDMMALVPAVYRMGSTWHISRGIEAALNAASSGAGNNGGEFGFNQALGVNTLYGYPVIVNDTLDAGTAADDITAVFGNLRRGIILGERADVQMMVNPYTNPGFQTVSGEGRFEAVAWEPTGAVALQTGAT